MRDIFGGSAVCGRHRVFLMKRTMYAVLGACLAVGTFSFASLSNAAAQLTYATFGVSGNNTGTAATATMPGSVFPTAQITVADSDVSVATSATLTGSTPFGQVYGTSSGKTYLSTSLVSGKSTGSITIAFNRVIAAGFWGFALGDVDAESISIAAKGDKGQSLDVSRWYKSSFNYQSGATDQPAWNAATATLRGNVVDTNGAAAWFQATQPVTTITLTQTKLSGFPTYQLWMAADLGSSLASPTPTATPTATATATATVTATPSASASPTATVTASASPTASVSSSAKPSASASSTASSAATPANGSITIKIADVPGAPQGATATEVKDPAHGTAVIVDPVTIKYTPDAGYVGSDVVAIVVKDKAGKITTIQETVAVGTPQVVINWKAPTKLHAGNNVIVNKVLKTNAGQRADIVVTCGPLLRSKFMDAMSDCQVKKSGNKITVWVSGSVPIGADIALSAPAKGKYLELDSHKFLRN